MDSHKAGYKSDRSSKISPRSHQVNITPHYLDYLVTKNFGDFREEVKIRWTSSNLSLLDYQFSENYKAFVDLLSYIVSFLLYSNSYFSFPL